VPNVPKEHKKTRYRKRKDIENQAKRQKIENQNTFPLNSIETLPSTNNPSSFSLVFPESTTNIENELKDPMPSTNNPSSFSLVFPESTTNMENELKDPNIDPLASTMIPIDKKIQIWNLQKWILKQNLPLSKSSRTEITKSNPQPSDFLRIEK